ncbi:MAG: hypothetical protein IKY30_07790 [Oscillospiraceae bacterium]|nr:hypothetical protein [Oscillospiraceae bacterium]
MKLVDNKSSEVAVCRGRQLVADHVQMRAAVEASKPTESKKFYVEGGVIARQE